MTRLLVATTNRGKLAELAPVLAGLGWEVVGLDAAPGVPVAAEDEDTLAGNARAKARHYLAATGLPSLADDSGLCVDALGGAPGVRSARFAGPAASDADNRRRLLEQMSGRADRRAHFACALCLAEPAPAGGAPRLTEVEGRCDGRLLESERGTGGFGYDPLFVPDDPRAGGRTFAELSREAKQALSHRGRALAALAARLAGRPDRSGRTAPGAAR
jgi:XTP/dITP diphosphohydrolase